MKLKLISPAEQFQKDNNIISDSEINTFHGNIIQLLEALEQSSEEHSKTEISERREIEHFFTSHPDYNRTNFSVEKDNIDLALKSDGRNEVLFETKAANAAADMLGPDKLNVKSFRQAVKYYLDELILRQNSTVKHIIITNGFDWYVFSAADFYRLFNVSSVTKLYEYHGSKGFYDELKPLIDDSPAEIKATFFNLKDYKEKNNADLQALYKLLSGDWLLRRTQKIDNNQLNTAFFRELLHIMGLEETGTKKMEIKAKKNPDEGSLLENIKTKIEDYGVLSEFDNIKDYGESHEEQLFEISLELVLTWVNRLLFLKLLEGQLFQYHNEDENYKFLDYKQVDEFDVLDTLFFEVLNRPVNQRSETINQRYGFLPYLNSSLFEPTLLEKKVAFISAMKDNLTLPLYSETVLINEDKSKGLPTLDYLLKFLGAYNFASHAEDDIYKEKGELINAAVLGLVFEKINGYKEGSFYTPGFITEYMSSETVTRAVIQKFNDTYETDIENLNELKRFVSKDGYKDAKVKAYNGLINSLKIVDPAVGSGHFLVSVMNIILSLKSDLGILSDDKDEPMPCRINIDNDTAVIRRNDNSLFTYRLDSEKKIIPADNALQKALFHEKRKIIENCLFGVDINPKSVKITRLRLWIELLKNAYYKEEIDGLELETLPNIDINIKTGNSLISRFALGANLKQLSKTQSKWNVFSYQNAVRAYKSSTDKQTKQDLEKLIAEIKGNYKTIIQQKNPKLQNYYRLKQAYDYKFPENGLFVHEPEQDYGGSKKRREKEKQKLFEELQQAKQAIDDEKSFYDRNKAFEWRFEFPEVLNENGDFTGFDIVIGNPPYGVPIRGDARNALVESIGKVPDYEIYYWFINKTSHISTAKGIVSLIIPNTILFNHYAKEYRKSFIREWEISEILDCTDFEIFKNATVRNIILLLEKIKTHGNIGFRKTKDANNFKDLISRKREFFTEEIMLNNNTNWALLFKLPKDVLNMITKVKQQSKHLKEYFPEISQGLIAYDKYRGQKKKVIENRAYHHFNNPNNAFKKWLYGRDVRRYLVNWNGKEYIDYSAGIANPRDPKYFKGKRILIREITNPRIYAGLTVEESYNDPAVIIIKESKSIISAETLLGILNSKFATFFHFNSSPKATKGAFPKILVSDIKQFPIHKKIPKTIEKNIKSKVSQILSQKQANPAADTTALEAEIDQIVYKLYGLTKDEIKIVEKSVE